MATVNHVLVDPLPWQNDVERVVCGRRDPARTITYSDFSAQAEEWNALVRSYHKARMDVPATVQRPNICGVCWDRAWVNPAWHRHPLRLLHTMLDRLHLSWFEPSWYLPGRPGRPDSDGTGNAAWRLTRELWALGELSRRHRAEFEGLVEEYVRGGPPPARVRAFSDDF